MTGTLAAGTLAAGTFPADTAPPIAAGRAITDRLNAGLPQVPGATDRTGHRSGSNEFTAIYDRPEFPEQVDMYGERADGRSVSSLALPPAGLVDPGAVGPIPAQHTGQTAPAPDGGALVKTTPAAPAPAGAAVPTGSWPLPGPLPGPLPSSLPGSFPSLPGATAHIGPPALPQDGSGISDPRAALFSAPLPPRSGSGAFDVAPPPPVATGSSGAGRQPTHILPGEAVTAPVFALPAETVTGSNGNPLPAQGAPEGIESARPASPPLGGATPPLGGATAGQPASIAVKPETPPPVLADRLPDEPSMPGAPSASATRSESEGVDRGAPPRPAPETEAARAASWPTAQAAPTQHEPPLAPRKPAAQPHPGVGAGASKPLAAQPAVPVATSPQAEPSAPATGPAAQNETARLRPTAHSRLAAAATAGSGLGPDGGGPLSAAPGGDIAPLRVPSGGLHPAHTIATPRAVAVQVAHVANAASGGWTDIALEPAELGHVRMRIERTAEGLTVHVAADRADVLDLMRRNTLVLQQEFAREGYRGIDLSFSGGGGRPPMRRDALRQVFRATEADNSVDTGPTGVNERVARRTNILDGLDLRL